MREVAVPSNDAGVRGPERASPQGHSLRIINVVAEASLEFLSPELDRMYSKMSRAWA